MDVRSRGGGRKIGEGRMLGNRSIKHYRTLPSPFFPIPVYHGSTYKLACVLIKVSAGRQLACQIRTHTYMLVRLIGLHLNIAKCTQIRPFHFLSLPWWWKSIHTMHKVCVEREVFAQSFRMLISFLVVCIRHRVSCGLLCHLQRTILSDSSSFFIGTIWHRLQAIWFSTTFEWNGRPHSWTRCCTTPSFLTRALCLDSLLTTQL